ncbi:hypothetical protein [Streptomyces sp. HD]|uniref:hypothetical protein n=1 Tax=Streptomyces sp. HD TaxID=3020892 RepID=UPI002330F7BD|nr:hypothetical protein [Streptomyces sp. HD]MDC0768346.1 hypothetical protein [Streptomyces sp. HD]
MQTLAFPAIEAIRSIRAEKSGLLIEVEYLMAQGCAAIQAARQNTDGVPVRKG